MPGFNLAAASAILKEDYLPPVREQLNQATPVLSELDKNTKDVVGKEAVVPLHVARGEAIGARSEEGTLPTARSQGYVQARFFVKYQYGRIEVNLPTIEATKSDRGAFIRAIDSETKGNLTELKEDFDRQLVCNDALGRGVLAACTSNAAGVITLTNPTPVTFRRLRVGMYVDFVNINDDVKVAGGTENQGFRVTAVDTDAGTITVTPAPAAGAITADHRVARYDAWKNEMRGYPGVFDPTATLQGVSPVTYPEWKPTRLHNSGTARAISDDLLQQFVDEIAIASGSEPDAFLAEHTQRRRYVATLEGEKRFVNTLDLKGGHKTVTFNDSIPFLLDRFYDRDRIGGINRQHQKLYELSDWDWADLDGNVLSRVSGKPAFEAFLYKYADLGVDRRNAFGVLEDLQV